MSDDWIYTPGLIVRWEPTGRWRLDWRKQTSGSPLWTHLYLGRLYITFYHGTRSK